MLQMHANGDVAPYRCPKKILIALPPKMLEQIDFVALSEHRTRSDLVREALRRYLEGFKQRQSTAAEIIVPARAAAL